MIGKTETDINLENSSGARVAGRDQIGVPPELHAELLREAKDEVRADLEVKFNEAKRADAAERKVLEMEISVLQGKVAEYERRLSDPEKAYREYQETILKLEKLLEEATDATPAIGANRIAAAKAAAEKGDFEEADQIFAEVEEIEADAVKRAAEAAFGRGLIAEEDVRWADAARHYEQAARLDESFDSLRKASEFAERAGHYEKAARFSADLVALTKESEDKTQYSNALNEHALNQRQLGHFPAAETAFREALEIDRQTIGEGHPEYATRLNNLAGVIRAQGRYAEAEALYEQALEIGRQTIGEGHPNYAAGLNNLAGVIRAQGRYAEAETLYEQALEIDRQTIGEGHPQYANHLSNLALLYMKTDRAELARPLLEQALTIFLDRLGPDHPHTKSVQSKLDSLPPAP